MDDTHDFDQKPGNKLLLVALAVLVLCVIAGITLVTHINS